MKRATILALLFTILVLIPRPAHALPNYWKGTPTFTRGGLTYRVKGHDAVVVKTSRRNVTIPAEVRYKGRWYEVRNVWTGALKGARSVTIHADLDGCESGTLWKRGVRVYVTRKGMYRWLHRTGANVTLIHCEGCK